MKTAFFESSQLTDGLFLAQHPKAIFDEVSKQQKTHILRSDEPRPMAYKRSKCCQRKKGWVYAGPRKNQCA